MVPDRRVTAMRLLQAQRRRSRRRRRGRNIWKISSRSLRWTSTRSPLRSCMIDLAQILTQYVLLGYLLSPCDACGWVQRALVWSEGSAHWESRAIKHKGFALQAYSRSDSKKKLVLKLWQIPFGSCVFFLFIFFLFLFLALTWNS